MQQTNPISQRIEMLGDKWNDATANPQVRIVRILAKDDEEKMCQAFFDYILSIDSIVSDIPAIFGSVFDYDSYSELLLNELDNLLKLWNETKKTGDFPFEAVDWKADYSLVDKTNPASLFVKNFNSLAKKIVENEGVYLTAILKFNSNDKKNINKWLENAIKADISNNVRIGVLDFETSNFFDSVCSDFPKKVVTIEPDFNMPEVVEELAAMGDPEDPATAYRQSFVKMMDAIGKRKEKETQQQAGNCLNIAVENINKNPFWIGQEVAVYTALANDAIGYKKWKKAHDYSGKAVAAALKSDKVLDKGISGRLIGQAYMLNGTILYTDGNYKDALENFKKSNTYYSECKDTIMQVEALRMCAYMCQKSKFAIDDDELDFLVDGFNIGKTLSPEFVTASSFPLLVKRLLKKNYSDKLSDEELNDFFTPIIGKEWRDFIKQYGTTDYLKKYKQQHEK